jgi:hypothetical protein
MEFVCNFLGTKSFDFLLLLAGEGKVSFGIYHTEKSLTPLGWAVIIIVPIALIFGLIYLTAKFLKKTKIK